MKKIPYGISNFKLLKTENYLYIDKTRYIETLENLNERYVIFLRPRRFGKSLFLSTLQYYYDENFKGEFEEIFRDTYIAQKTTSAISSYRVLFMEFSGINTDGGLDSIYEGFRENIKLAIHRYFTDYGYEVYSDDLKNIQTPTGLIKYFFEIVRDDKVYLLIDEYDHFSNAILAYSMQDFLKIVGKGGFVRSFYEVLKGATQSGIIQKMFITGVTPITLDSLSSGFNIVSNISHRKPFNAMAGFTEEETRYSLETSVFKRCAIADKEKMLESIKTWYNGYLFNLEANERIYNATLVNYFISTFNYDKCAMPIKMLDVNVASDYKAIMKLFNIGDSEKNYTLLQQLIETNRISGEIKDRYDLNREFSHDDFITLIYSMGFITLKNELFGEEFEFQIPNYVIKMLYFNYFAIELKRRNNLTIDTDIKSVLRDLALGDQEPFVKQLNGVIRVLSNRDHMGFDEKYFQVIALSFLSFADSFYFIESQPEKERRYPDIMLIGRDERVPHNYLLELKWLKGTDRYETVKAEGIKQVRGYLELDKIKTIPKLRSFLLLGSKEGVEFMEISN